MLARSRATAGPAGDDAAPPLGPPQVPPGCLARSVYYCYYYYYYYYYYYV